MKYLLDSVSTEEYNYAIEFRHRSWLDKSKKEIDTEILDILRRKNVANVLVDGPGLSESSVSSDRNLDLHVAER